MNNVERPDGNVAPFHLTGCNHSKLILCSSYVTSVHVGPLSMEMMCMFAFFIGELKPTSLCV